MHNLNQKGCFRHMEKFPMNNTFENNNLSTVKVQIFLALYKFLAPTGALEEGMLSVHACVHPFPQIMSSSSILKSPGGF